MSSDSIFDALLHEAAGNDAPDVTEAVLKRATEEGSLAGALEAPSEPEGKLIRMPEPLPQQSKLGLLLAWTAAACAAIAIGWIIFFPPEETIQQPTEYTLPKTVAIVDGEYEYAGEAVRLQSGMAVIRDGAPTLQVGENSINEVRGVVIVLHGDVPNEHELMKIQTRLRSGDSLKPKEIGMLHDKKWIVRGGVAMCVLVGSVVFNGDTVESQARIHKKAEKKVESVEDRADNLMKRWDKNSDGVVTAAESNEELMTLDANEDGEVTLEEASDHFRKVDARRAEEAEKEAAAKKKHAEELEAKAEEAGNKKADDFINKLDKNDDGKVSKAEAEGLGAEADSWMKKLDKNDDGEISDEEAKAYFKGESLKEEKVAAEKKNSSGAVDGIRRQGKIESEERERHEREVEEKKHKDEDTARDSNSKKDK